MLRIRVLERTCVHVNFSSWILKGAEHTITRNAMRNLNATTISEKLVHVINNVKCATGKKFIFRLLQFEKYRNSNVQMILFAHENKTMLQLSKIVCTRDNLKKLKDTLKKPDAFESRKDDYNTVDSTF